MYLILGSATVIGSVVVLFLLPDVPSAAWFLTKEERVLVIARVSNNLTGIKATNFSWSQFREAICDVNTWLLVLNQLALNIPNGGLHPVSETQSEKSNSMVGRKDIISEDNRFLHD